MNRTLLLLVFYLLSFVSSLAQVTLNYSKAVLPVGQTLQLTASTSKGEATDVIWGAYEEDIASVSATGLVTARKVGETIVYAMLNDGSYLSGQCVLQVVKSGGVDPVGEVLVKQISFPRMPVSVTVGQSLRLQATVSPANATNRSVRWTLAGTGAYITGDVLFATDAGEVTVTAEALDGSMVKGSFVLDITQNADARPHRDGTLLSGTQLNSRSQRCVTYDLGQPHVITRVGYRTDGVTGGVQLGVFEGANRADFADALPLHIIRHAPAASQGMQRAAVETTRAFRYVRFKGPEACRPRVGDVEFWGERGEGSDDYIAQLTNLPTIVINTVDEAEPQDNVTNVTAYISLISKQGTKILTDTAGIRLRGNSSRQFPKKPYRIKWDEKHHVLSSPAKDRKWVLINNYSDKTLIRNMVGFELSRCMGMVYTPFCTMADVIVNGDYRGTYQLADKIELGKNRLDIPKEGSYMVESDMCGNMEPSQFSTYYTQTDGYQQEIPWTVQHPDDDERTPEQYDEVRREVDALTQAAFAAPLTTSAVQRMAEVMDVSSFLRYFLIEELAGNSDAYWSMLMYRVAGDSRWYSGPVWDFDIAFDNNLMCTPASDKPSFIYLNYGAASGMKYLVDAVMRALEPQYRTGGPIGTAVPQMLTDIWSQARYEGGLTEEHLLGYVDSLAAEICVSQDINFKRWPILTTQVQQEPGGALLPTFYEHIDYLKAYLSTRLRWMDQMLGYEGIPTHLSPIAVDVNVNRNDNLNLNCYDLQGRIVSPAGSGIVLRGTTKSILRR